MKFNDKTWTEEEWQALLEKLIYEELLSWKDITTIILGQMNPSQVGTSLASSEGFKRRYGKGTVMPIVMKWFYQQDGQCRSCGSRLELQADHDKPREEYEDPLDADFIENMVLRCRRCNVIKRPSHEFGGTTHLTAESALMWILFSFRPRTRPDFIRMCRLYGMTMADIRMQEGWAMAHWLRRAETDQYIIDTDDKICQILLWPDGGITRCWHSDEIEKKSSARVLFDNALPIQHLITLAYITSTDGVKVRVQVNRYAVANLPFSHYSPVDAEWLAITYTPPNRKKNGEEVADVQIEEKSLDVTQAELMLEQPTGEEAVQATEEIIDLAHGGKINLMPPRGMTYIGGKLLDSEIDAIITCNGGRKEKTLTVSATARIKKVCDMASSDITATTFIIK